MRGRGIDFKQKFNTSRWAEDLLIRSLDDALGVKTVRYGISTFVPEGEELVYGNSKYKEPDLLVFKAEALKNNYSVMVCWTGRKEQSSGRRD